MAKKGKDLYAEAAEILISRRNAVALTGAGISVESGIPAFRGAQGLWERFDPAEYATIGAFRSDPEKVWAMLSEMIDVLIRAKPNPAHAALAELERMGILRSVITQNVDGLHQAAGSRKVIEFHGNPKDLLCISCGKRYPSMEKIAETVPPRCACGAVLKPDIVFFGEQIPSEVQEASEAEAMECGVLLIVGTSAQVAPASGIPGIAKRHGACVLEVNPEKTVLTPWIVDMHLQAAASEALTGVLSCIKNETGREK